MKELLVAFNNHGSTVSIAYPVRRHLEQIRQPITCPLSAFDYTLLRHLNDFGTKVCRWSNDGYDKTHIFEIQYPEQLDENLLKKCIVYDSDDHLHGRGLVCKVKKNHYLTQATLVMADNQTVKEVKTIISLLDQIEIKKMEHLLPKYTKKGIQLLTTFHNEICLKESLDCTECENIIEKAQKHMTKHKTDECVVVSQLLKKYDKRTNEFLLLFSVDSYPAYIGWPVRSYLKTQHISSSVFDSTLLRHLNDFGLAVCNWKHHYTDDVCLFEISHPTELEEKIVKECLHFDNDGHPMGRGLICKIKKHHALVRFIEHFEKTKIRKDVSKIKDLLNQVKIKQIDHGLPKYTEKGIDWLKEFHTTVCSTQSFPCYKCPEILEEYDRSNLKMEPSETVNQLLLKYHHCVDNLD